ncbi:MAG TPA: nucleotidyl transferase AbiEii/AbiGii toxin family protein [Thermoanaerobaculia bacterium]|nr:nucleotidyl transferase AbiEii/AbiGii toxin family protein [Thermoanaerobaculia bacterium]
MIRLDVDLRATGLQWALVGGFAVSLRVEPRTTRDLDVVLAVSGDREAERAALSLRLRGYRDHPAGAAIEAQDGQLSTIRLISPLEDVNDAGIPVDLLVASSGVETEIVAAANLVDIGARLFIPVARSGHLLALKVLAGRVKDQTDAQALLRDMTPAELQLARETLDLIEKRGFHRGKNLLEELARIQQMPE